MAYRVFTGDWTSWFKQSTARGLALVSENRGYFFEHPDGYTAIQLRAPRITHEYLMDCDGGLIALAIAASFRDAWGQIPSGGVTVWQLRT